jgi:environmental stress-induced protein Ves
MIRHLTPADYLEMPWANGRGVTVEMLRVEEDGALVWRLSRARVVEDGPFSLFPGVERNLTVISGPGFDLVGDGLHLIARPLVPLAFPGDVPLSAAGVAARSDDFNVMTARTLPRPEVLVHRDPADLAAGGMLCLFALGKAQVGGLRLAQHDLIMTEDGVTVTPQEPVISVRLFR